VHFQHERSTEAKAQTFLQMLPRRGPTAFERFIAALRNCEQQQFIADELERQDGPDLPDTGRSPSQSSKSDEDIIRELTGSMSTMFSVAIVC